MTQPRIPGFRLGVYVFKDAEIVDFAAPYGVLSVARRPATPEGMRRILQNGQLVTELTAEGAPIEVRIALARNPRNASGFSWSSSDGPRTRVSAGSIVRGRVVVDRKPVIAWLIPRAAGN